MEKKGKKSGKVAAKEKININSEWKKVVVRFLCVVQVYVFKIENII